MMMMTATTTMAMTSVNTAATSWRMALTVNGRFDCDISLRTYRTSYIVVGISYVLAASVIITHIHPPNRKFADNDEYHDDGFAVHERNQYLHAAIMCTYVYTSSIRDLRVHQNVQQLLYKSNIQGPASYLCVIACAYSITFPTVNCMLLCLVSGRSKWASCASRKWKPYWQTFDNMNGGRKEVGKCPYDIRNTKKLLMFVNYGIIHWDEEDYSMNNILQ